MKPPNFEIVEETEELVLIRDVGPWDLHLTVTNAAELVVALLASRLKGRRLEYYDSEGERSQLFVHVGKFAGFGDVVAALPLRRGREM